MAGLSSGRKAQTDAFGKWINMKWINFTKALLHIIKKAPGFPEASYPNNPKYKSSCMLALRRTGLQVLKSWTTNLIVFPYKRSLIGNR